jgi:RNA polymerase sigma-70 factor (ECF subfamily)
LKRVTEVDLSENQSRCVSGPGDQEIIATILAGDSEVYAVLVERYQRSIFNLMFRMTGSYEDAVDLTQETFIKAYEQLHRFQQGRKFFSWLYTIGLNHSKNFLRKNSQSRLVSLEEFDLDCDLGSPCDQEKLLCARSDDRQLQTALNQLPVEYREAVLLRYFEDLSMDDVAESLGLSVSGAKMRIHRGLKKLRDILDECNVPGEASLEAGAWRVVNAQE